MASRYSVIQYLPDPATDERINVGVLAYGGGEARARFVRDWRRIRGFGGPDTAFLREFAREVEAATSKQGSLPLFGGDTLDPDELVLRAGRWKNSIQLTQPRASTLEPDALVDQVAKQFLRDRVPQARRGRDRRAAAGTAVRGLQAALRAQGSRRPEKYVSRNEVLEGKRDSHRFDVALVNGTAHLGVLAMSFEGGSSAELEREVRANAWTIDDLHEDAPDFPIAVVTIPPRWGSKIYQHAIELFEDLEADVVPEEDVDEWAEEAAADVYKQLVSTRR